MNAEVDGQHKSKERVNKLIRSSAALMNLMAWPFYADIVRSSHVVGNGSETAKWVAIGAAALCVLAWLHSVRYGLVIQATAAASLALLAFR